MAKVRILLVAAAGLLLAGGMAAQKRVSSEKTALPELGDRPTQVLKVETVKGTVKKVDLEKRTVSVDHAGAQSVFTFPTAAGREKISLSKKVAAALGKKSLHLEELTAGCRVKVAYYPTLGSIMEITIEELAR